MKLKTKDKGIESLFSFFAESEQMPYTSSRKVIAQINADACVAACARMILADHGIDAPESYLAAALEISDGALLSQMPRVLKDFGLRQSFEWRADLSFADLSEALRRGSAVVTLRRARAKFGHALVAYDIFDDEVRLPDPLPKGLGKSYAVSLEKFSEVFLRKRATGTGVIYAE